MPKGSPYRKSSPTSDLKYVFSYNTKLICAARVLTYPSKKICVLEWRAILGTKKRMISLDWDEDNGEFESITEHEYGAVLASKELPLQEFYDKTLPITDWVESHIPLPKGYTAYRGPKYDL